MRSLDTNIVLRLLLGDVPMQAAAVEDMLASAKPNSFAVADLVFFECAYVLAGPLYRLDRATIGQMLLHVTEISQINCNRTLITSAVPLFAKHSAISFADVCLAVYADLNNAAPLLTYDKRLAKKLPHLVEAL